MCEQGILSFRWRLDGLLWNVGQRLLNKSLRDDPLGLAR